MKVPGGRYLHVETHLWIIKATCLSRNLSSYTSLLLENRVILGAMVDMNVKHRGQIPQLSRFCHINNRK